MVGFQVEFSSPFPWFFPVRALGVLLIVLAILVLLESFARFALQGVGTPAPVLPTRHLVVKGSYRYVRNPMYLAVVSVILGQGYDPWEREPPSIWRDCLAELSSVCFGLRGTNYTKDVWG